MIFSRERLDQAIALDNDIARGFSFACLDDIRVMRDCCRWKRSSNDTLRDVETGREYCGSCWQAWFAANLVRPSEDSPVERAKLPDFVDDDESLGPLEGLVEDGCMYLVSRARKLVFCTERADDGRLRCAGILVGDKDRVHLTVRPSADAREFPFAATPEDHCETPFEAYEDLSGVLGELARSLEKTRATLRIWDPFYCDGAVKRHFARLGFLDVHNECEDWYAVVRSGALPPHDCIVTNPPYSTEPVDHIHELVNFLCVSKTPWFVVQPNYVYTKPYWHELTSTVLAAPRPFFLTPSAPRRYKYETPAGLRDVGSAQQLRTSPFVSVWYCWAGASHTPALYRWLAARKPGASQRLSIACTEFFLPDAFKDSSDRTRKKSGRSKKKLGKRGEVPSRSSDETETSIKTAALKRANLGKSPRK